MSTDTPTSETTLEPTGDEITPEPTNGTPSENAAEGAENTAEGEPDEGKAPRTRKPDSEAAKRRVELRAVEAERDALRAERDTLQRQIVEGWIEHDADLPFLHRPADLWEVVGTTIDDIRDESGGIDRTKLADALEAVKQSRPYLIGTRPLPVDPLYAALQRQGHFTPSAPKTTAEAWQQAVTTLPTGR